MKETRIQWAAMVIMCLAVLSCMVCMEVRASTADTSGSENYMISGDNGDGTVTDGQVLTVDINGMGNATQNFVSAYKKSSIKVSWRVSSSPNGAGTDLVPPYSSSAGTFTLTVRAEDVGKYYTFNVTGDSSLGYNTVSRSFKVVTPVIDVTVAKNGIATIKGSTGSSGSVLTFEKVWIDARTITSGVNGKKSFTITYDTKKLDAGYHEVSADVSDGREIDYPKAFPVAIYNKPSLKSSRFKTYKNYAIFTAPSYKDSKYDYYLQIKKRSGKWGKLYGPFAPKTPLRIKGLSSGCKYSFRALYIKKVTYGGKTYYMKGPWSAKVTVKTGPKKKPPVKSVKISKAKHIKVWVKPETYVDKSTNKTKTKKGHYAWKTSFKVTVRMKKKPGIAGLYIGNKLVKGNKKTYTASFKTDGKLKGKKINIEIYSMGNKTYGAYSPIYKKKLKIK